MHDVIIQRIVPFTNKLYDDEALMIIGIQNFDEQGFRTHKIPSRVYVIAINGFGI
jgi:hypothetical protein